VPANSFTARQRLIVEVVPDSPAEKAGLVKGDTILSINGLAASAQAMSLPFEPGDKVVLRVKRNGRERDVTVVATERKDSFVYSGAIPDSIGQRMAIIMDRMRTKIDTISFPRIEMRSLHGDSVTTIILNGDTIRIARANQMGLMIGDSIRALWTDSLHNQFARVWGGDSSRFRIFSSIPGDSARFHFFGTDSVHFARPFEVFSTVTSLGPRAVAGAELTPLNPGLAQYFGATDGVLVLDAREGTPAARAGLQAGDVITQANGVAVTSIAELRRTIERTRGDTTLRVLRSGRSIEVTLRR
jgi:membrane-associated protease RseP (regulator of RpoE activity)